MSDLTINGVQMQIVHTRLNDRRAVASADGTTYLYTRHVLDVDAVVNPAATSYTLPGNTNANAPRQQFGQLPATTDVAIRDALVQRPARVLYRVGAVAVISTPATLYTTDALNGPYVEVLSITQVHGERTFQVSLKVVAHINEAPQSLRAGFQEFPVLLAHRWKRWEDTDRDHWATITTQGVATFRTDELIRRGTVPDQYRPQLFHAIPFGCRRLGLRVVPSEDGASVYYEFQDKHVPFLTGGRWNCTWVEAYQKNWCEVPSFLIPMTSFIPAAVSLGAGNLGGAAVGLPGVAASFIHSAPTLNFMMTVRVWGNVNSSRSPGQGPNGANSLNNLALGVIASRIGFAGFTSGPSTVSLAHDLTGKYVEGTAHHTMVYVDGTTVVQNTQYGIGFGSPQQVIQNSFSGARLGEVDIGDSLFNSAGRAGLAPPRSTGTRGSLAASLMAEGLSQPHQLPPDPPAITLRADATL